MSSSDVPLALNSLLMAVQRKSWFIPTKAHSLRAR